MRAWQLYVWAFSVVLIASAIGRQVLLFKKPDVVGRFDVAESYFSLLALPALFGFVYQRAYGPHLFLVTYCALFLALNVYQFFTPKMKLIYRKGWKPTAMALGLQLVIGFPTLWALVKYSYFEPRLWS